MAKIVGNLTPEDDGLHALGPEPNFNESMYFNFFDAKQSLGGFVRLGNRANEGQAEMTVCLFLPDERDERDERDQRDQRVLFAFKRAKIDHNDAFDAGGLRFEVLLPTERVRTTYEGGAIELANPKALSDPGRAFRESPRRRIALDLLHEAVGPMYGGANDQKELQRDAEKQFAKAHYEQHMRVTGTMDLGDARFEIDGYGLRDHSWGPRHWQAIERYEWLTMNFGSDLGAMVSRVQVEGAKAREGGVIVRGDELQHIAKVEIEAEYEENGLYHRALVAKVETREGERHEITGVVKGFIPLRNRREGMTTHIGEGMTEWTFGDRTGYGLSEFLRQV